MLDVNERRQPAAFFLLRNHWERQCRFTGRFGPENFHDSPSWKSAHAKSAIDQNISGGDDLNIDNLLIAKAHDGAFTVIFGYLLDRQIEVLIPRRGEFVSACLFFGLCR